MEHVAAIFEREGADAWWERSVAELARTNYIILCTIVASCQCSEILRNHLCICVEQCGVN